MFPTIIGIIYFTIYARPIINTSDNFTTYHWYSTLCKYNGDSTVTIFYDALHQPVVNFATKCSFRESTYPPWFSTELKHILDLNKNTHANYKSFSNVSNYNEFLFLRTRLKHELKKSDCCCIELMKWLLKIICLI